MPNTDQDRTANGDNSPFFASAGGQAMITGLEKGIFGA
jgi:hypothetical protein